ncbi:MAG: hypothetical protein HC897_12015 [Thermoanaerobaculia bacterium]|nr:hypothetical protein [Thermoanaerobaculia bacterium]
MKPRILTGMVAGILLLASSAAHAFLGWPPFAKALAQLGADSDVTGGLQMGWMWGSATLFGCGLIVVFAAIGRWRGRPFDPVPSRIVAGCLLAFGIGAFLARDFNPHFLLFIVLGVLVRFFAAGE